MKVYEKLEARRLRSDLGLPITVIAKQLNVAKSSVSLWVKDIPLTEEQKQALLDLNPVYNGQAKGATTIRLKALEFHKQWQQNGRAAAKDNNLLHQQGCMLYWCEGAKSKNSVKFANSDPAMMSLFIKFLRHCYNVSDNDISLSLSCYVDDSRKIEDIENYWLDLLSLKRKNLRKHQINPFPKSSFSKKKGKLQNGVCYLTVHDTELLHNIYGAIQEYGGFENKAWLG